MNWYSVQKYAFEIKNFTDRNVINARIRQFKKIITTMNYLVKYEQQNRKGTKKILEEIGNEKLLSSYPKLKEMIDYASFKALDSYKETSAMISDIVKILIQEMDLLIKARNKFTQETLPKKMKGFYGRH